jgi:competence protein ComEC
VAAERPSFVVHVADVGTGLGVFVEGEDFALVYDAGSNDDLGTGEKNRFVAYLRHVKPSLKRIDHVLLSHPHRDHVELLADVLSTYEVANVWDSGAINSICGYRRFVQAVAEEPGVAYHTGVNGAGLHVIDFGKEECPQKLPATVRVQHAAGITEGVPVQLGRGATMTILHVDGTTHSGDKFNENSLVTVLDLDGTKVLFMGDAEAGGREDPANAPKEKSIEGYVLAKYRTQIDADVLVAGHHGSMSSSRKAFVDAVSPKVSVISSGPTKYQSVVLPDPVIRDELSAVSTLLATDKNDATCGSNAHKIGPVSDGRAGGCDNVQIKIHAGQMQADYLRVGE